MSKDILISLHGSKLGLDSSYDSSNNYIPYLVGQDFRGMRIFKQGAFGKVGNDYKLSSPLIHNELFEDFLGKTMPTRFQALPGSDGLCAVANHALKGGTVRLTTGAGSTHTMAVNGAELTSELNWEADAGGLVFEARVGKISALTSQSIFIGLTDNAALEMPFTLSVVTLTSNASDACGFLQDAAGTNTHLNLVGVKADTDATLQALTNDVDTAAFHLYRIELTAAGVATFYIDGVQVGTAMTNALTATVPLTPVVAMFSEATSASQTLDVDAIYLQQLRA